MGKDFHSKCENIFPKITLFKTDTNLKFGEHKYFPKESNYKISEKNNNKVLNEIEIYKVIY